MPSRNSRSCRRRDTVFLSRENRVNQVLCLICGKEFQIYPGITRSGRGKYCSRQCYVKSQRQRPRTEHKPNCTCEICGHEFYRCLAAIKVSTNHYCSEKCSGIGHSRIRIGQKSPNWGGGLVERQCIQCGQTFTTINSQIRYRAGKFCSRACFYANIRPTDPREYPERWNKSLQEQIRDRDEHRCTVCGISENCRKHHIHHIDYDKGNLDPMNLVTLCASCHAKANFNRVGWQTLFEKLTIFPEV